MYWILGSAHGCGQFLFLMDSKILIMRDFQITTTLPMIWVTGPDILFFWVGQNDHRPDMSLRERLPFKNVYLTGIRSR